MLRDESVIADAISVAIVDDALFKSETVVDERLLSIKEDADLVSGFVVTKETVSLADRDPLNALEMCALIKPPLDRAPNDDDV